MIRQDLTFAAFDRQVAASATSEACEVWDGFTKRGEEQNELYILAQRQGVDAAIDELELMAD